MVLIKGYRLSILALISIIAAGCASIDSFVSGPLKARVVVAEFEVKVSKKNIDIGKPLRVLLIDALKKSNRFIVLEPQAAKKSSEIISVTVTDFEPLASGGKDGLGGGGSAGSSYMGGLLGPNINKVHIGLEIRIAEAASSEVLAMARISGETTEALGGFFKDKSNLGNGLSEYIGTPMEKAILICINESVRFISQSTPVKFYRYYR